MPEVTQCLVRELDQDLLAEAAHDGLVDGPGEVGGGQEEDAALPLRLQPVQLHQPREQILVQAGLGPAVHSLDPASCY